MSKSSEKSDKKISTSRKFTFYDILNLILSNWYWFVLSFLLFVLCAEFYIRRTPPVYQRTASVLVKDSRKGGSAEFSAFSDITGVMGRRSVDNEIYIFKSYKLMEQVVRRYDLATRYTTKGRIRTTDLYGRAPIEVKFLDAGDNLSGAFNYVVSGGESVNLYNFSRGEFQASVVPGDTVTTPMGRVAILPTPYINRYNDQEILVSRMPLNTTVEQYRNKLKCEITDKQASVIKLTMNDEVILRAEQVINGIIDAYNADAIEDKRTISNLTEEFIIERLATLGNELGIADDNVAEFKRDNQIYNPAEEAAMGADEIMRLKKEAMELAVNLEMAQYILDYIGETDGVGGLIPASVVTMSGASTALASQIEVYNENLLLYNRLVSESSDNNPFVLDLGASIITVRGSIVASLESHIEGLKLHIENIEREQRMADSQMNNSPTKEKELLSIMRQQKVKEELYIYLLTKLEENALTGATAESNARVIDWAHGSNNPVSPRKMLIYVVALCLGFVVPLLIIYMREKFNTKVRSRKDIEEYVSAPMLGEIPRYTGRAERGIVVRDDGRDAVSEAFRMLRTNINYMTLDRNIQVVMLTSSVPHSGKTFVSLNLALTYAISGKRVLIMDLDLRRRTLTKLMGHRNDRRGITTLLAGGIGSTAEAITKGELSPNIDIMYAGPQPPNPAEMLMSSRMEDIVKGLRESYDIIIVDNVPAMAVADAFIVGRLVDITIYVVRQNHLDRSQLPDIERMYEDKKFDSMAVVFNGVTHSKGTYGYGYGYGYYTDDDDMNAWRRYWHKFRRLFKKRR